MYICSADEVREYVPTAMNSSDSWSSRKHKVNLSNIREKYRDARIRDRFVLFFFLLCKPFCLLRAIIEMVIYH
jgi:hypothetical protein